MIQEKTMSDTQLLEINLISAQNLKRSSPKFRKPQMYAVVYVNPKQKLRTRVDRVAAESPTWNDKFIFRVTDEFLNRDTSAVNIDIFAVGVIKDTAIGSVRLLISTVIAPESRHLSVPAFVAVQVRRPCGEFQGVLNVGAAVIGSEGSASLSAVSAIGFRDMMGEPKRMTMRRRKSVDSFDFSDEAESMASSKSSLSTSSSTLSLKEELAGEGIKGRKDNKEGQIGHFENVVKAHGSLDVVYSG